MCLICVCVCVKELRVRKKCVSVYEYNVLSLLNARGLQMEKDSKKSLHQIVSNLSQAQLFVCIYCYKSNINKLQAI